VANHSSITGDSRQVIISFNTSKPSNSKIYTNRKHKCTFTNIPHMSSLLTIRSDRNHNGPAALHKEHRESAKPWTPNSLFSSFPKNCACSSYTQFSEH